jgi:hypothetical protein
MRFTFFGLKDSVTLYIFLSQESSGSAQKNEKILRLKIRQQKPSLEGLFDGAAV